VLTITDDQWASMVAHVQSCLPEEGCGLLEGLRGRVDYVIPVTNADHSPFRFRMEPREQIEAMGSIEERGLELVGIYHSHPNGPSGPSPIDLAEAAYPEAIHLILSSPEGRWQARAFRIRDGRGDEIRFVRGRQGMGDE
ncbi:MAG: Mov34/MPN/PAD-1 family protein, partial [Anaerolineales bacterium]